MTKCVGVVLLLLPASVWAASSDTIQFKGNAAITGRILTEKPDQVVVDIGYTVMVVPRNQVVKVLAAHAKSGAPTGPSATSASRPAEERIYYTAATPMRSALATGYFPSANNPRMDRSALPRELPASRGIRP